MKAARRPRAGAPEAAIPLQPLKAHCHQGGEVLGAAAPATCSHSSVSVVAAGAGHRLLLGGANQQK